MSKERVELVDILQEVVKGDDILWDGSTCVYKHYDIMTVFGRNEPTAIWVRQSMPDIREKRWLRPEDPNFFEKLKEAVALAKQVIDETEETKRALDGLRSYMLGTKPGSGPVA